MDMNKIKKHVQNPNLIPGIYNYCDRWCERCAFTQRCAKELNELVDVIRWYQNQIHVKIMRAVMGRFEEKNEQDDYPKDSDGSAKVALIGMDRSISAWGKMLSYFPEQEDELLNILVHLEKLRRNTEHEFPDARAFIRPGFDE